MGLVLPIYNVLLHILYCIPIVCALIIFRNTKQKIYLYFVGMFFFYSLENLIIFLTEYSEKFALSYNKIIMTVPTIRTIIYTITLFCLLQIITNTLTQKNNIPLIIILALIIVFLLFIPMMEESALKAFLYYLPSQMYYFIISIYGISCFKKTKVAINDHIRKDFMHALQCVALFSIIIVLEDYYVIFHVDSYQANMIHINNRSYSENVMTIILALICIRMLTKIISELMVHSSYDVTESCRMYSPEANAASGHSIAYAENDPEPVKNETSVETVSPTTANSPAVTSASQSVSEEDTDYSKFYLFCKEYQLTTREQDVLKLLLDDMNNTEISEALCISIGTTKAHIHNVYAKVDVKRRRDLMQIYEEYSSPAEDNYIYANMK